jgi:hypothetical protein
MIELTGLGLVAAAAWFWFDSLRAREAAIDATKSACAADGVVLLDDTVALAALRLRRTGSGTIGFLRVYRFEFTDTGDNRLEGSVTLVGAALQTLYLEPHGATSWRRLE